MKLEAMMQANCKNCKNNLEYISIFKIAVDAEV
jgi:hypothetical protein